MNDVACKYEVDLALMKNDLKENTHLTKEIHDVLYKNGLVTKLEVHDSAIKRLWWWLGIASAALIGVFINVIIK